MPPRTTGVGIREFLTTTLANGPSLSNTFEVTFSMGSGGLAQQLALAGFTDNGRAMTNLTLLCEEASLPGILANTGQTTGRHLGEGQINYAHTKSYQDITLSWICDANMLPLKFLNAWMKTVFSDSADPNYGGRAADTTAAVGGTNPHESSRTRLNYPDTYMCKEMTLLKGERDRNGTLSRLTHQYKFYDIWPYTLQSTPLSYGSSQLLSVSASFYYRKWFFTGAPQNVQ